ncbi:hypothetical protein [Oceanobacter mangrovi]|uniref:hypothetical protein n=1 Tax=Oceanobacter mangrovi TaxID=2862510 RepID=UPI001C8D15E7|nr:hypothetical protein [Oceanobacter mangrovi]
MAAGAGSLQVTLTWQSGRIVTVDSQLQRPLAAINQLLQRHGPEQACQILPLLFAVCGEAHSLAGRLASGVLNPSRDSLHSSLRGVLLENIREYLLRWKQHWYLPFNQAEFQQQLKAVNQAIRQQDEWAIALAAENLQTWLQQAGGLSRWQRHFRLQLERELGPTSRLQLPPQTRDWQQFEPAVAAGQQGYSGAGASALLEVGNKTLIERLSGMLEQQWQGLQHCLQALVQGSIAVADWLACRAEGNGSDEQREGWVKTSRGWLLHRLAAPVDGSLVDGSVADGHLDWQIYAPTDVNFCGPLLACLLTGIEASEAQARILAQRLMLALDPCVEGQIELINLSNDTSGSAVTATGLRGEHPDA